MLGDAIPALDMLDGLDAVLEGSSLARATTGMN